MKKGLKRTLVGIMSAAVIAGIVPVNASAITKSDKEDHDFYGRNVTIRLNIEDDRASASTSAASADKVEAKVKLAYTYNGETRYAYDYNYSYNATVATATAQEYRPYSKYAEGEHRADFYIDGTSRQFERYWRIE